MTVAHKDMTGADLHEVKGASTAIAGQVPVSDGAGAAAFARLTHTSLRDTGNPFGAQLLHVREEQANGVASTTTANAVWQTQVLNTVKTNEISGASLASSTITLPAGTYHFKASAPVATQTTSGASSYAKLRLRNTTLGTTILAAPHAFINDNLASGGQMNIGVNMGFEGRFTLVGISNLQLQTYITVSLGLYPAASLGETEAYGEILIWKVA